MHFEGPDRSLSRSMTPPNCFAVLYLLLSINQDYIRFLELSRKYLQKAAGKGYWNIPWRWIDPKILILLHFPTLFIVERFGDSEGVEISWLSQARTDLR
jgi:hypothetical protein